MSQHVSQSGAARDGEGRGGHPGVRQSTLYPPTTSTPPAHWPSLTMQPSFMTQIVSASMMVLCNGNGGGRRGEAGEKNTGEIN